MNSWLILKSSIRERWRMLPPASSYFRTILPDFNIHSKIDKQFRHFSNWFHSSRIVLRAHTERKRKRERRTYAPKYESKSISGRSHDSIYCCAWNCKVLQTIPNMDLNRNHKAIKTRFFDDFVALPMKCHVWKDSEIFDVIRKLGFVEQTTNPQDGKTFFGDLTRTASDDASRA